MARTAQPGEQARAFVYDESELIEDLQMLVDRNAPATSESIDVTGAATFDQVQHQIGTYLRAGGAPPAVTIMVGEASAGVVTRESLERSDGTAAEPTAPYELGAGERLQLPGYSTRYRLLEFACSRCPDPVYRIYYDARDLPSCAHGQMELRR